MFSKVKTNFSFLWFANSSKKIRPINEPMNTTLKSINGTIVSERRRTDRNQEDVTIVCLSKNNNILQEPLFLITLRTINDYIQVRYFYSKKQSVTY